MQLFMTGHILERTDKMKAITLELVRLLQQNNPDTEKLERLPKQIEEIKTNFVGRKGY